MRALLRKIPPRVREMLWHGGKAAVCTAVLSACITANSSAWQGVETQTDNLRYIPSLLPVILWVLVYIAIQVYFNNNDDYAFNRFCEREETPQLLREPAYLVGLAANTVGATVCLLPAMGTLVRSIFPRLLPVAAQLIALLPSLSIGFLVPYLHLRRLFDTWRIQKTLRRSTDKQMKPVKRVIYAVIYSIAVCIVAMLAPALIGLLAFIPAIGMILWRPALALLVLFLVWRIVQGLRRIRERKHFLDRLESLRDRGELSFTVHGHPYLSLFFRRVEYGLTVTDEPHRESKTRTPTTYQIAVANCNRRRMTIILCPDNIFQFVYSLRIRAVGPVGAIGMGGDIINIPLLSLFRSHSFDFPEGEGKRILLVDPAPVHLCMRGFREGEYITLDNASEQFGYTVFGKNAFVSLIERI